MTPDLTVVRWRMSARTDGANACVEAAALAADSDPWANDTATAEVTPDRPAVAVAVRNSTDRGGPALIVTDEDWDTFVTDVRSGRLDYTALPSVEESGPFKIVLAGDGHVDVALMNDPGGPMLRYTRQEWDVFTAGATLDGEFTLDWLQRA